MKVIIADTVEVAPKEGTIIRFEDRGLVVIGPLQFEIDEQLNTTWYKE